MDQNNYLTNSNYTFTIVRGSYQLNLSGIDSEGDNASLKVETYGSQSFVVSEAGETIKFEINDGDVKFKVTSGDILFGTSGDPITTGNYVRIRGDTEATSCETGLLRVGGGVGIVGNLYTCGDDFSLAGGVIENTTTDGTVTIDANLVVSGTLEISGDGEDGLAIVGDSTIDGSLTMDGSDYYDACIRLPYYRSCIQFGKALDSSETSDAGVGGSEHPYVHETFDWGSMYTSAKIYMDPDGDINIRSEVYDENEYNIIKYQNARYYTVCINPLEAMGWIYNKDTDGSRSNPDEIMDNSGLVYFSGKGYDEEEEHMRIPVPWVIPHGATLTDAWVTWKNTNSDDTDDFSLELILSERYYHEDDYSHETGDEHYVWKSVDCANNSSSGVHTKHIGIASHSGIFSTSETLENYHLDRRKRCFTFLLRLKYIAGGVANWDKGIGLAALTIRFRTNFLLPWLPDDHPDIPDFES